MYVTCYSVLYKIRSVAAATHAVLRRAVAPRAARASDVDRLSGEVISRCIGYKGKCIIRGNPFFGKSLIKGNPY